MGWSSISSHAFDKEYMFQEFNKVASLISKPVTLFIIGGGGLAFYGLKETTKDIDIVLRSLKEIKTLVNALKTLRYHVVQRLPLTYKKMGASTILENKQGFRWDIFHLQVCNSLTVSEKMVSRSIQIYVKGLLRVLLVSKEDLFLFKSVTEREADLDDMRLLAESGVNWKTIQDECSLQSASSGRLWENALYEKLTDLRKKHKIESPIEKSLRSLVEEKLSEINLIEAIAKGNNTVSAISLAAKEPEYYVRRCLNSLVRKGRIKVDKSSRPYKYFLDL